MNDKLILSLLEDITGVSIQEISLKTSIEELGVDSLDMSNFSFELEDTLGFRVDITKFPLKGSIHDLLLFIEQESFDFQNGKKGK